MNDEEYKNLYKTFIETPNSLIVAPAGFGKTHTIAESIASTDGKFLVLTHTHAGVASIRQKLKKLGVNNNRYNVETIAGYVDKYVHAFTNKTNIPLQEDKGYYSYLYKRFLELLAREHIIKTLQCTYRGVIIDEYQDCDIEQHSLVLKLSGIVDVHILGDELQGIFSFNNKELAKWDSINEHFITVGKLNKPWRWINGGNEPLGEDIARIREKLVAKEEINLEEYKTVHVIDADISNPTELYKSINGILNQEQNVLFIEPDSANKYKRLNIIKKFSGRIHMIESIDDADFYNRAKLIDSMQSGEVYSLLLDLVKGKELKKKKKTSSRSNPLITNTSSILKDEGVPNKRGVESQKICNQIKELSECFTLDKLKTILLELKKLPKTQIPSKDLFNSLVKAIEVAAGKDISVYDGMVEVRNNLRRVGRTLQGRVIGTTLLTKGLEMDCVVIIGITGFTDEKNLYVALSRACKSLVVITKTKRIESFVQAKGEEVEEQLSFETLLK